MNNRLERINRVRQYLQTAGVVADIRDLAANTATAQLAAAALSCQTAEIAKSVVFQRQRDGLPIVVVLCGDNRVDLGKLTAVIGDEIGKTNAAYVKEQCGFEIGGVAPLAHTNKTITIVDWRLSQFSKVWAAAGSAYTVFGISPPDLVKAAHAQVADIAE